MEAASVELDREQRTVITRRYLEARAAGLDKLEARIFAHSGVDVGLLRKLVACGCEPRLIARIVL